MDQARKELKRLEEELKELREKFDNEPQPYTLVGKKIEDLEKRIRQIKRILGEK
jgi:septation ring formation regulator EzrA